MSCFLVGPFVYFHTSCVRTVEALVRLRRCAGSPEPSLVAYVILWSGTIECPTKTDQTVWMHLRIWKSSLGSHDFGSVSLTWLINCILQREVTLVFPGRLSRRSYAMMVTTCMLWTARRWRFSVQKKLLKFYIEVPKGSHVFGQTGLGEQCRPRSGCSWRSNLIRVYTVCHSVCIFWIHYSMVKPPCSNFRVITANFWCVQILGWLLQSFGVSKF